MTAKELAGFIRNELGDNVEVSGHSGYTDFEGAYNLEHGIIDGHYNLVALSEAILKKLHGE